MERPNKDFRDERSQDGTPRLIDRRNGGCAALVGSKLYVWGGQTEEIIVSTSKLILSDTIDTCLVSTRTCMLTLAYRGVNYDMYRCIHCSQRCKWQ